MEKVKRFLISILLICFGAVVIFAQERVEIKYGPYLQNLKETETTIVWVSNKPSIGWVELAPDDGSNFYQKERSRYFDSKNGVKNTSLIHSVKISDLKPGTTYRYRVYSQEILDHQGVEVIYGRIAATDVWSMKPLCFTTNDRDKKEISFTVLNDIHGRTNDISELLNAVNYEENDMVIYNGDMVSQSKSEEQVFNSFMNKSIELFAQEKPMYYARGNHETRGVFATSFQNYFSVKEPHLYFTLRQGPAFFIFLDTGEDKPDSDIEYSGITDYDNYRTEQAKWLEQVIESDEFKQASYKIVIGHMPPVEWQGDIWHGPTEVLEKFIPILNKGKIDVMISGHYHINKPGYYYYEPSEKVHFPVLVNESVTALKGKIDRNSLKLQVVDKQKNILFEKTCLAK